VNNLDDGIAEPKAGVTNSLAKAMRRVELFRGPSRSEHCLAAAANNIPFERL